MLTVSLHHRQGVPPFSVKRIPQKGTEFFNQVAVDFWFICKYLFKFLSLKAKHLSPDFPAI